jgi:hypothetical protein
MASSRMDDKTQGSGHGGLDVLCKVREPTRLRLIGKPGRLTIY